VEWVGDGGVEGRSERGAGGGAGPMMRRRLEVVEEAEELREEGEGEEGGESSSERLRLVRWGGRVGPTVGMFGFWKFWWSRGIDAPMRINLYRSVEVGSYM